MFLSNNTACGVQSPSANSHDSWLPLFCKKQNLEHFFKVVGFLSGWCKHFGTRNFKYIIRILICLCVVTINTVVFEGRISICEGRVIRHQLTCVFFKCYLTWKPIYIFLKKMERLYYFKTCGFSKRDLSRPKTELANAWQGLSSAYAWRASARNFKSTPKYSISYWINNSLPIS